MKFLWNKKDGGPFSKVEVWGVEIKSLFSVLICRFRKGSRDAYHSHAFSSISWVLKGEIQECELIPNAKKSNFLIDKFEVLRTYKPSFKPIITRRETFHKVIGKPDNTIILTFRGPWWDFWFEENESGYQALTHGRKIVTTQKVYS